MKKLVLVSALALAMVFGLWSMVCISAEQAKEKGLVGYWNFDEGKGETAKDASGNNNNGAIADAKWVPGKFGTALEFDGAMSMVEIPHSKVFDVKQLTIEMWIKTPDEFELANGWRAVLSKEGGGSVDERDYNFYGYSADGVSVSSMHFSSPAKFGASMFELPKPYAPATWHHIAITIDADGKHVYYSDGVNFAESAGTPSVADGEYSVFIGKADNYWKGAIDEVKIYNRALGPDEIKAHASKK